MDGFLFRNLNISTITINVESNLFFHLEVLFKIFTSGTISSQKSELSQKEYKDDYLNQVHIPGTISYICYKNNWYGTRKKKKRSNLKKRNDFVNQVTLDIFVENHRKVNVMIFGNGKIKLAGCKNSNDALSTTLKIYDLVINTPALSVNGISPTFIFVNEMINISFVIPFVINKIKINKLFNEFKNCISFYEQTGQQYVNIKMLTDLINKKAIKLEILDSKINIYIIDIQVKNPMKTCFMLFDKRVIMSGVDYLIMEKHFYTFKNILLQNKETIKIC
jgi:hypothetical protein